MEPISIAVGAFTAIKSGIAAGKELHSMGKDLAKLWNAIDEVDAEHHKAKSSSFKTVEEEAMDTFLAKTQAKDMEDQLRQLIILTRGVGAWAELVKMRADIRVQRQEARKKAEKERQELQETIIIVSLIILGALAVFFVVAFIMVPDKVMRLLNLAETLYSSFSFLV